MVSISFVQPETELLPSEVELLLPEAEVHRLKCESSLQKSLSMKEKCKYVLTINALIARGLSCCHTCSTIGLPHNYYARFKTVIKQLDKLMQEPGFVSFKTNGTI
jgi:hypothetical protein